MNDFSYIGSELELFSQAHHWKKYYKHLIDNYLQDKVLEVGAGIGATTQLLCQRKQDCWICLEPDPLLADNIKNLLATGQLPAYCELQIGTLSDLSEKEFFDTILYIDVLEHIRDDVNELKISANSLKKDGKLIVLAPAHQWLFTPFDRAVGHYRRYNKSSLSSVIPTELKCLKLVYLDSVGLIASIGNRFILKSEIPNRKQIQVWDAIMIPLSQKLDFLIRYSLGKSILGVWRKKK
jgi:SAM-dependent methyltransferase